ncbi:unnamed protein product, partial [Didymodactylos carnosus]
ALQSSCEIKQIIDDEKPIDQNDKAIKTSTSLPDGENNSDSIKDDNFNNQTTSIERSPSSDNILANILYSKLATNKPDELVNNTDDSALIRADSTGSNESSTTTSSTSEIKLLDDDILLDNTADLLTNADDLQNRYLKRRRRRSSLRSSFSQESPLLSALVSAETSRKDETKSEKQNKESEESPSLLPPESSTPVQNDEIKVEENQSQTTQQSENQSPLENTENNNITISDVNSIKEEEDEKPIIRYRPRRLRQRLLRNYDLITNANLAAIETNLKGGVESSNLLWTSDHDNQLALPHANTHHHTETNNDHDSNIDKDEHQLSKQLSDLQIKDNGNTQEQQQTRDKNHINDDVFSNTQSATLPRGGLKRSQTSSSSKKMVRFADSLGLDLAQIKYIRSTLTSDSKYSPSPSTTLSLFKRNLALDDIHNQGLKPWDFDLTISSHYNQRAYSSTLSPSNAHQQFNNRRYFCLFRQPNSESPDVYLHEIWRSQIKLEYAEIRKKQIKQQQQQQSALKNYNSRLDFHHIPSDAPQQQLCGTLWVTNIDFLKYVSIKYTFNRWMNTYEKEAIHKYHSQDYRNIDNYEFTIDIPNDVDRVEFILRYSSGGQEHYDNNYGNNYIIEAEQTTSIAISLPHDYDFNEMRFY